MPEIINSKQIFSLLEVTKSIQKTIAERYQSAYWIKAEMNKLNFYSQSGHCYPELVEKSNGKIIAQIKANLWKDDYTSINKNFLEVLKEPLKDGIKILFQAKLSFDPAYGMSLRIIDIDPSFTLGDLEREKQDTITSLRNEGLFDKNKTRSLPLLPQRIAIISVETSKGYADFRKVIDTNPWKYKFFNMLFPSLLQGEKAVDGIIFQLRRIKKVLAHFDVVAIIRGGGGDVGLSCYNNYALAKEIASFPIPVITGIGHATNETVAEMISFCNQITPTKLAEYLLQQFHNFSMPVQKAHEKIIDKSSRLISEKKNSLNSEAKLFRSVSENLLIRKRNDIKEEAQSLSQQAQFLVRNEEERLLNISQVIKKDISSVMEVSRQEIKYAGHTINKDVKTQLISKQILIKQTAGQVLRGSKVLLLSKRERMIQADQRFVEKTSAYLRNSGLELTNIEKNINNMSPREVMRRGYSITLLKGKALTDIEQVKEGDLIESVLFEGSIASTVKSTTKSKDDE